MGVSFSALRALRVTGCDRPQWLMGSVLLAQRGASGSGLGVGRAVWPQDSEAGMLRMLTEKE